jgi:hypothetical protein
MGSRHQESRNPFGAGRHGVVRSPEMAYTSGRFPRIAPSRNFALTAAASDYRFLPGTA